MSSFSNLPFLLPPMNPGVGPSRPASAVHGDHLSRPYFKPEDGSVMIRPRGGPRPMGPASAHA